MDTLNELDINNVYLQLQKNREDQLQEFINYQKKEKNISDLNQDFTYKTDLDKLLSKIKKAQLKQVKRGIKI